MIPSKSVGKPVEHAVHRGDGAIVGLVPWSQIATEVSSGTIVVLKGAFDPDAMLAFRHRVLQWGISTPPFPHGRSPSELADLNYHRVDDGGVPSTCPHVFHQFGFKAIDRLDDSIRTTARTVAEAMKDVQNNVAGTSFEVSPTDLYLKVLHYPPGGGYLTQHSHPLLPQKVGLIMSLSRVFGDLEEGSTVFETPSGPVDVAESLDIGDIALFRYDVPHAVTPVDPAAKLDWHSERGKWSVVLELRDTHRLSHGGY